MDVVERAVSREPDPAREGRLDTETVGFWGSSGGSCSGEVGTGTDESACEDAESCGAGGRSEADGI